MNICFLTSTYLPQVGGLEIVVHNLATALTDQGHKVYVVTPMNRNKSFDKDCGYKIIRFGFRGYGKLHLTIPLVIFTLAYVVRRYKTDIIHVHNVYGPGSWAYYFNRIFKRTPIVGTPHGDDVQIKPQINYGVRLSRKADKIVRRNLNAFKLITAVSPFIRKDLEEIVPNPLRIRDVPNGVWTGIFKERINKSEIRKKYGIPFDSLALISVGRNHPCKGYDFAIEAIAKLKAYYNSFVYILVGRNMSAVIERAKLLGVSELLITPGELSMEKVAELFKVSDIFVSPSIIESFGLTTLEAMSAGLPSVVTNVDGNRNIVASEWSKIVLPGDSHELEEAVKYLIENPSVRNNMGIMARKEALKYNWPGIAKKYIEVYREAIESQIERC